MSKKEYKHVLVFKHFNKADFPTSIDEVWAKYNEVLAGVEAKSGQSIPRYTWNNPDVKHPLQERWDHFENSYTDQQFNSLYEFHRFWADRLIEFQACMLWNDIRNHFIKLGDKNGGGEKKGTSLADAAFAEFNSAYA